ncbi:response regulator [Paraburkholderia guartelaensis]|uniref:Response regulator n=1 Tax=Paraburkholderia guartelaensis TaxID=2546446 RepID=A0ABU9S6E4_9BURK
MQLRDRRVGECHALPLTRIVAAPAPSRTADSGPDSVDEDSEDLLVERPDASSPACPAQEPCRSAVALVRRGGRQTVCADNSRVSVSSASIVQWPRFILVDDDPNILPPLRILLEAEGYRVLTALNGLAAMPVTAAGRPDVIVTDWMMPAVDGVAFCRWLKADPATATIPVVMLSAALPPCPTGNLWDVLLMKHTPIGRLLHVIGRLLDAHGTAT